MKMIPMIFGARCRKSKFTKLCAATVKKIDQSAETTITKLSERHQIRIRSIFGSTEEVYGGCLSDACLDYTITEWIVDNVGTDKEPLTISRCTRCFTPKSWGRGVECKSLHRLVLTWEGRREQAKRIAPCDCENFTPAMKKRRGT